MQYANIRCNDGTKQLLSAKEFHALHQYKDSITDSPLDEDEASFKLVYGSFKPQSEGDLDSSTSDLKETKGFVYATIKNDRCQHLEVTDIVLFDPIYRGYMIDVPFAALIKTTLVITNQTKDIHTCFLRYKNLSPATNILNRPGVLCIVNQDKRVTKKITPCNWDDYIDQARANRSAQLCV